MPEGSATCVPWPTSEPEPCDCTAASKSPQLFPVNRCRPSPARHALCSALTFWFSNGNRVRSASGRMLGEGLKPCCRVEWPDAATVTLIVDGERKQYDTPRVDVMVRARGGVLCD